jgi:hypothetical protein
LFGRDIKCSSISARLITATPKKPAFGAEFPFLCYLYKKAPVDQGLFFYLKINPRTGP